MLWSTMGHIFVAQGIFLFIYIIWPLIRPWMKKLAAWIQKKYGEDAHEDSRDSSDKTTFKGKWRAYEEQAYSYHQKTRARERQKFSGASKPKSPPARPLTPRAKYLKTLGLSAEASKSAIRSAYRSMAKRYHPDKYAASHHSDAKRAEASAKMRAVNEAYDWLQENPA